jgi:hypothetical protein
MGMFGQIMAAIFGTTASAATASPVPGSGSAAPLSGTVSATPGIDVAPILDKAVAARRKRLEPCMSFVGLMKALDIDSRPGARNELAKEPNYSGDTNDSAAMNIWLRKQVMTKLAANGGKLPADIKS